MRRLHLVHWNDVHGRFEELSRMAARARVVRAEIAHDPEAGILVLDGGDIEDTGVRLSGLTKGVAGWRLLGAAGVDAAVAGNGGLLRFGPGVLPDYAAALGSPPLVCNVSDQGQVPDGAAASRLVRVGDLAVGIVGFTAFYSQYEAFGLLEVGPVTAIRRECQALRRAGAEVMILLSHAGRDQDRALSWMMREHLDLIVGGHTHHVLDGDLDQAGVPIVQAGHHGRLLGRTTLTISDSGEVGFEGSVHEPVDDGWPRDPAVDAEWAACERDLDGWLATSVGVQRDALDFDPTGVSPVAGLVIEALLAARPAQVGVLLGGQCEAGLAAGEITRGEIWSVTSSPGNLATATLTGRELARMIAIGTDPSFAEQRPRAFRGRPRGRLHLVGAQVGPAGAVTVAGEQLDPAASYTVTGSDLELSAYGGMLTDDPADLVVEAPEILPELLEAYLRARDGSPT